MVIAALDDDCDCCDIPSCEFEYCGRLFPESIWMTVTGTDARTACLQDRVVRLRYHSMYLGFPFWRGRITGIAGLEPDPLYVWLYLCNDVDLSGGAYGFLDYRSAPPSGSTWFTTAYGNITQPASAPNIGDWVLSCDPLVWIGRWVANGATPVDTPCTLPGFGVQQMDLLFTEDAP